MKLNSFVVANLINPRDQIWGQVLFFSEAGVTIRGISLDQVEEYGYQFRKEERDIFPFTVFFPMRRVEKLYLDEAMGTLPAIKDRIAETARLPLDQLLI